MYKTETKTHMHSKIKSYESLKGEKISQKIVSQKNLTANSLDINFSLP